MSDCISYDNAISDSQRWLPLRPKGGYWSTSSAGNCRGGSGVEQDSVPDAIQIGWNGPLALLLCPMNETLASWRQAGKLSLWRYRKAPRMYADWHFSADSSACESLLALIALLTEEQGAAHRTLTLIDPQTVGADRIFGKHDLRIESPAKLRLGNAVSSNGTSVASFADDAFLLMLDFKDLADLAEAVRDLAAEKADFAIRFGQNNRGPGTRISFWWWPKSQSA